MTKRQEEDWKALLKAEAKRYSETHGLTRYSRRKRKGLKERLFENLRSLSTDRKWGLAAITISYPGLIPLIACGRSNLLSSGEIKLCLFMIAASAPLWMKADLAHRREP
jgi:hypothetical protein